MASVNYREDGTTPIAVVSQDGEKFQAIALYGAQDGGRLAAVPVTAEGHMEVAIHGPRLPFGEVSVESLYPIIQCDAVYGVNTLLQAATVGGGGSATAADNLFSVSPGDTTPGSFGAIQSVKRLRYRPGQGVVSRFTALFSSGQASTVQVAGIGTGEAGAYFGYNGTSFGVLTNTGGVRAIHTLTVTVASNGTGNYAVELNGTTFNITATNNASTIMTAYEISKGTYSGWKAEQIGSTVVFLSDAVGAKAGAFSLSQAGGGAATGTYATTKAGVAVNDTWVPQSSWNGDTLDGSGDENNPSGILLAPSKGNVYSIGIQYLGFGAVTFQVEVVPANGNNSDFVTVHTLRFPNTSTAVSFSQPSFPFTMSAANVNTGVGGVVTTKSGSFAGFIAGQKKLNGPRMSYYGAGTSSTTIFVPLFTMQNKVTFGGRANQAVVNALSVSGAARGGNNSLTSFYLVKNATLSAGVPNFQEFSLGKSCTSWDTAATAVTWATADQVQFVAEVAESGQFAFSFSEELDLQPGDTLTLCCKTTGGTAGSIAGSMNTREDQ